MVVVLAVHGADERDVVNDRAEVRHHFRQLHAALAVTLEFERHPQQLIRITHLKRFDAAGNRLPLAFLQLRLAFKQVHLAGPAVLHELNYGAGASGEVAGTRPQIVWDHLGMRSRFFLGQEAVRA